MSQWLGLGLVMLAVAAFAVLGMRYVRAAEGRYSDDEESSAP